MRTRVGTFDDRSRAAAEVKVSLSRAAVISYRDWRELPGAVESARAAQLQVESLRGKPYATTESRLVAVYQARKAATECTRQRGSSGRPRRKGTTV
jgi:hypothetical protein